MNRRNFLSLTFLLLILFGAVIFVCLPLFHPNFFVSDDGGWLIIRLTAFYQSFRDGQFPVRFLGRLNFGYGYPVANFNYPGYMYIGSLIHYLGATYVDTVKIILGGSVCVGTFFTFLWLKKYFSELSSLVGALGFTFAPYVLFDLYHRGSVGEVLAISTAAAGLYSISANKRWLFGLVVPFLILSHNVQAVLLLGLFFLYITVLGLWREYFFTFAAGIGMGAFFWLPALYERKYIVFDSVTVGDPRTFLITTGTLFLVSVTGIIASVLSLLGKKLKAQKILFIAVLVLVYLLVFPVSAPLWKLPLIARTVQFPFRLLSLTIPAGAWLTAYVVAANKKLIQYLLIVVFIGLGIWTAWGQTSAVGFVNQPDGYYSTNESTSTIADEYMPKWVINKPTTHAPNKLLFYQGRGTIRINHMNTETIDADILAAEDSIIQINTLYYPGWGATVDDTKAHIDYFNTEDVMRIAIPAGKHHLIVAFRETISRFLADIVSLISFVVFIVFILITRSKKRRKI